MHDSERERIFSDWLAGHKGILFKVVHAYAFEHADRQDLFQEIVIQIWRSVDAFRGESSVPTWMYRVALNTAIAWTRKEDRHQRGKQPLAVVEGLLTTSSSDGHDPRVEWRYRQIAQLKDVDRSVALLLLDGFSYKEIAAIVPGVHASGIENSENVDQKYGAAAISGTASLLCLTPSAAPRWDQCARRDVRERRSPRAPQRRGPEPRQRRFSGRAVARRRVAAR